MKIAVLGANGRSGRIFIEAALAAGHSVRAGVYHANTLQAHEALEIIQCDATNEGDIKQLVEGQDAIVSLIGHVKDSAPTVQTDAIRVVVRVLEQAAYPRRLVSLTGTGVRVPGDRITLVDRVLNTGVSFIDPQRVSDGIEHAKVLQNSSLAWTIVRVLKLQGLQHRTFTLQAHGPTLPFVSRSMVAKAILKVLEEDSFVKQLPILSR
jgi:putative NADH-flavin reductase